MKRKKKLKLFDTKYLFVSVGAVAVMVALSVTMTVRYSVQMRELFRKEVQTNLAYVSTQNKDALQNMLNSQENFLAALAAGLEEQELYEPEQLLGRLSRYAKSYGFYNMGVVTRDGVCHTTLGEHLPLEDEDYVKRGFAGEFTISDMRRSEDGKDYINIFTMPVYRDGQVEILLTAPYRSSQFARMLDIPSFDGGGHSMVVDRTGAAIAGDEENGGLVGVEYELWTDTVGPSNTTGNYFQMEMDGAEYLGYVEELGLNNWYLVTYIGQDYVDSATGAFTDHVSRNVALILGVVALFCVFFSVYYRVYSGRTEKMLFEDSLTGDCNFEYLRVCFRERNLAGQEGLALLVMDVDKLKLINMLYGMQTGDEVILLMHTAFKRVLQEDEIYRRHADEYVALLHYKDEAQLRDKLNALHEAIQQEVSSRQFGSVSVSMGVCPLNQGTSLRNIYGKAVLAKNEIKDATNRYYCIFDEQIQEKFLQRGRIETTFEQAVRNDEFQVWYQPKYSLQTGRIVGAEALVRWKKPTGEMVSPANFIPVFEENGQIIRLDEHVLEIVCRDIREMKQEGLPILPVSVNLSRMHLHHPGIVQRLDQLVGEYRIQAGELAFEITESAMLNAYNELNTLLDQLHERGYHVDMDDYGSGVSSLGTLAAIPFDTIKIDKSFVDHLGEARMNVVVRSTVQMALELELDIVAEGIETRAQADFLREIGCRVGQGYYFSRPLPKDQYAKALQEECPQQGQARTEKA